MVEHGGRLTAPRVARRRGARSPGLGLRRAPRDRAAGRAAPACSARPTRSSATAASSATSPDRELRLYAAPISAGGRQVGTVVAGESLAAYDRTTDLALVGSLAFGALLLAAVLALTSLLIGRALGRVRDLTRSAAEWSRHDDPRRFGSAPQPDELGELARTLDSMMDRVASSLRHEQRLSAELSHELRTPLARIIAEVELLERRERSPQARADAYAAIARSADQMSEILETLMAAARADAGLGAGRSELAASLQSLRRRWEESAGPVALELDAGDSRLVAGVDREVVERILSPLLENARRHARTPRARRRAPTDGRRDRDRRRRRAGHPGRRARADLRAGRAARRRRRRRRRPRALARAPACPRRRRGRHGAAGDERSDRPCRPARLIYAGTGDRSCAAVTVGSGKPRSATRRGRSTCSQCETWLGGVSRMISP